MKHHFFAYIFRMRYIARWALMRNTRTENVEEHSYEVAVLAHALAVIGRDVLGKKLDPHEVASAALFHDASEIITGDMPTPVKYNNPEIQAAYKSIEHAASDSLLRMLPEELQPQYKVLFAFEADHPELYRYVKAADKISAYIKCVEELRGGNDEFRRAALQTRDAIAKMAMPEADYYMEQFAPAFSLSLDELQEEDNQ